MKPTASQVGRLGAPLLSPPNSHFIGGPESVKNIGDPRYIGRVGQPDIHNLKLWLQTTDRQQTTDRGTSTPVEASLGMASLYSGEVVNFFVSTFLSE